MDQIIPSSSADSASTSLGGELRSMLAADDIQVGSQPSYQLCKSIYVSHPLGAKMVDGPVKLAQSQTRRITVGEAPSEVTRAFEREWQRLVADGHIANVAGLSRIYGIATLVLNVAGEDASQELDPSRLAGKGLSVSELDPLNTAGSLVLDQIPTSPTFNRPVRVSSNGTTWHPSRFVVVMNERPIYLSYTDSAFGFVGRSVYQRALFPMKSYLRTMIANDMVQSKLGLIVAKTVPAGPVVTKEMTLLQRFKALFIKQGITNQVLTIGDKESIETLDMQNVDGAGTYSRTNIIKDIATAADMPAKLLDNETLVAGFGEGTEDAKNIARYVETIRHWLTPLYRFFDGVCQRRAWDENFFKTMQVKYPEAYGERSYGDVYSEWRDDFTAEWPSFLIEPESEQVRVDDVRLQAVVAVVQTAIDAVDPGSQLELLRFLADNVSANRRLFPHALEFDWETLETYLEDRAARGEQGAGESEEFQGLGPEAKRFGQFRGDSLMRVKEAIARLPSPKRLQPAVPGRG